MLFTEKQAIEKYCCGPKKGLCIASECMAWVFVVEHEHLTEDEIKAAGMAVWLAHALKPVITPPRGYCGLIGKRDL